MAPEDMTQQQLAAILVLIDSFAPLADETCETPGITLSEASRRMLIDEGHPAFVGQSY